MKENRDKNNGKLSCLGKVFYLLIDSLNISHFRDNVNTLMKGGEKYV